MSVLGKSMQIRPPRVTSILLILFSSFLFYLIFPDPFQSWRWEPKPFYFSVCHFGPILYQSISANSCIPKLVQLDEFHGDAWDRVWGGRGFVEAGAPYAPYRVSASRRIASYTYSQSGRNSYNYYATDVLLGILVGGLWILLRLRTRMLRKRGACPQLAYKNENAIDKLYMYSQKAYRLQRNQA